jgi:hypothetical protein
VKNGQDFAKIGGKRVKIGRNRAVDERSQLNTSEGSRG